jgi:eukaryotic-like serine/threonine-protein kinase
MPPRQSGHSDRPVATSITSVPPEAETVAGRYVLVRELGAGGVGAVFLAKDLQTGEAVALKQLSRVDAKSVLRFKREFRSLAHVQHRNLVRLYDLEREPDGMWFLTMEYLPGTDLISHLRPDETPDDPQLDFAQVIDCFAQLARGISALHEANMLHRDLKPSNVLVCDGRVVVLDFGLVRGLDERDARVTEEGMVTGTPAYMAPEQAMGKPLTAAADWYAFGAMLYEALADELPFDGSILEIMRQKVDGEPEPIERLVPDAPRMLTELCGALLRRDPMARPSGPDILARLGASPAPRVTEGETTSLTDMQSVAAHFVGREEPLQQLVRALANVERGQAVAVHVRGRSGAGKSALLERFLFEVEKPGAGLRASEVLVLRSRCYEREAMPFKALDSIMDALVVDLAQRDDIEVSHLLPGDIEALAQLFPVLERVRAVKQLLSKRRVQSQARSHRQRAEAALRELFARLAQSRPLIVWVDDLHWGDLDSVTILRAWLEQNQTAPFLLLLSYRSDEVETSPALRALLAPNDDGTSRVSEEHIEIGPLTPANMRAICIDRLGMRAFGRDALIERIVQEADGNPFLASQLASLALARIERGDADIERLSIDDLITQTRDLLPQEAMSVLAVLAVAGKPMAPKLALRVAGVRHGGRAILHALRNLNLVRTRDADTDRLVEIYHDRIREHVYSRLPQDALRTIHGALLRALEHSGRAEADWLHSLALGADDLALAFQYGVAAADRAHAALAFERAAELYTRCLELCPDEPRQREALWKKLGLVLAYAGRGLRAAEALLEAARLCENAGEAIQLKQMAASHFMRSGRYEQGDALFDEVIAAASIRAPRAEGKLVAALVWERARLAMRGLSFQARSADQISPAVLKRIDLLEDLRIATMNHDALRSALFSTQSLRLALDAGEPLRIARSFVNAAVTASTEGTSSGFAKAKELLARAEQITGELGTALERMELNAGKAAIAFYEGRLMDVLEPTKAVELALRDLASESGDAAYYFKSVARAVRVGALSQLDWRLFKPEFLEAKQEAQRTENVHAILTLALNEFLNDELAGQPELSIARLDAQRNLLPRARFTVLHVLHLSAIMYTACATGQHAWGLESAAPLWQEFMRSPLRRVGVLRTLSHVAHGRLLLNDYVRTGRKGPVPSEVISDIKHAAASATHQELRLRGRVAYLNGDPARALELFKQSAEQLEDRGCEPEALRDRYAMGVLIGGQEGARMVQAAFDTLENKYGLRDPQRNARAFFPEFIGSVEHG